MCWRGWWSPGAIRWPVVDLGCGSRTQRRATSPKRPRLGFSTLLTLASLLPWPEPAGLLCLVIRREHHQHDLPQHQSQPDRRHPLSIRRAPSSGSVWRRWLRLKAATLNRFQVYYIIKLPELIFSIKFWNKSCSVVFFRTTMLSFYPVYIFLRSLIIHYHHMIKNEELQAEKKIKQWQ